MTVGRNDTLPNITVGRNSVKMPKNVKIHDSLVLKGLLEVPVYKAANYRVNHRKWV